MLIEEIARQGKPLPNVARIGRAPAAAGLVAIAQEGRQGQRD
jgi:hypothetical protein